MTESNQPLQELNRAADKLAGVTNELRVTVERLLELEQEKTRQLRGPLPEEEAVRLAQEGVRTVRPTLGIEGAEVGGEVLGSGRQPQPSPEEIKEWEQRREERRRREGY